jgi:hypothetical protein
MDTAGTKSTPEDASLQVNGTKKADDVATVDEEVRTEGGDAFDEHISLNGTTESFSGKDLKIATKGMTRDDVTVDEEVMTNDDALSFDDHVSLRRWTAKDEKEEEKEVKGGTKVLEDDVTVDEEMNVSDDELSFDDHVSLHAWDEKEAKGERKETNGGKERIQRGDDEVTVDEEVMTSDDEARSFDDHVSLGQWEEGKASNKGGAKKTVHDDVTVDEEVMTSDDEALSFDDRVSLKNWEEGRKGEESGRAFDQMTDGSSVNGSSSVVGKEDRRDEKEEKRNEKTGG